MSPDRKVFQLTFARLKHILQKYEKQLTLKIDKPDYYSLDAGYAEKWKRKVFFGAVAIKKNYVSFYLMPTYTHPELLNGLSPALKKRMQGKSCFNFAAIDNGALRELAALTNKGYQHYKDAGWAPVQRRRK